MFNVNLTPSEAYDTLRREPVYFLKHYPVRISGRGNAPGVESVFFRRRAAARSLAPGAHLGSAKLHDTISFEVRTANQMRDEHFTSVVTRQPLAHRPFPAHFVHVSADMQQMEFYRLPLGGPKVMVTPQLTGCSFVMEEAAPGEVRVAHVRPTASQGGAGLQAALASDMASAQVYGADASAGNYDSADRIVSIIGVLRDAGWVIYAQKLLRDVDVDRIVSVYQIYPTREKL